MPREAPHALVLFSGGLDSLLAAKLLQRLGLSVLCLHFLSPFFGNLKKIGHWQKIYGVEIRPVDVSREFTAMLAAPPHGTGKTLNPCIDCKIVMLQRARELLAETGAGFIASGEVLGQRPMSQRTEALNIIAKASGTRGLLLRPLCARHLAPTPMEESGLIEREKLLAISGRGRNEQLALAREWGICEIPSPAGGCRLTERENARRYWPLLERMRNETTDLDEILDDFSLVNRGRILFSDEKLLCVGKNEFDNNKIHALLKPEDALLRLPFAGPLALARKGASWPREAMRQAAEILASFSPRAMQMRTGLDVSINFAGSAEGMHVQPDRHAESWSLPQWESIRKQIQEQRRKRTARAQAGMAE